MILLISLTNCKTTKVIKLESPYNFENEYQNIFELPEKTFDEYKIKTNELHKININRIIELKRIIRRLWIQIILADKKNITVIDLRTNEDKEKDKEFEENLTK